MATGKRCKNISVSVILISLLIAISLYSFSTDTLGNNLHFRQNNNVYHKNNSITNDLFRVKSPDLSTTTVQAEIDFKRRFLDYAKQDILHMTPPTYVPEIKNPCWYEYGNTSEPTLHCLPFFMILGQNKCATSDLYLSVLAHPDVIPARDKEPQFWARHRHCYCCGNLTYSFRCRRSKPWTWKQYTDFFKATAKKIKPLTKSKIQADNMHSIEFITGEASPSNLWDSRWWWNYEINRYDTEPPALTNADYLHHFLPNLRMIIILRNPVTRLYSDYLYISTGKVSSQRFHQEVTKEIRWFRDCVRYHDIRYCVFRNSFNEANVRSTARLQNGFYAVFIEEYMKIFPREQFHILRLEEYSKNKTGEMKKIFRFLNLRDSGVLFTITHKNKGSGTKTDMLPETKALLTKFYKPYNVQLANLLRDRKFLWID